MRMFIRGISALALVVIGAYMISNSGWPNPPFLSGIAFIIIAVNTWMPVCPICAKICPVKK